MSKDKFPKESRNRIRYRSSSQKPFYKKIWFWLIIIIVLLFGFLRFYLFNSNEKIEDDIVEEVKKTEDQDIKDSETENSEAEIYGYEDFEGIYVTFEGEAYNSPISGMSNLLVLEDNYYRTFNRWDYDMSSTILEKTIEENILTLDLDSAENEQWGLHSESGEEQFKLNYDGDKKYLYWIDKDLSYYPISEKELESYYRQNEIDYARIIMTMRGAPSLDSWAVFAEEYEDDKPIIGVRHRNKGETIPHTADDGDDGYPEDVTVLYLKNKARQDDISYTYSSIGEGYIKVYPVALNHAIRTGKEVINQAEEIYIEPFEPYMVADFIGHVEFDHE